jgi:hypothetical protein
MRKASWHETRESGNTGTVEVATRPEGSSMISGLTTFALATTAAVAMVVPGTTGERDEAQPRGENQQFHFWVTNRNNTAWNVQSANLKWGKWCDSDGQSPESPKPIPAKGEKVKAFCAQGRKGSPSGTEGEVKYVLATDSTKWFSVYFDVPVRGDNDMKPKESEDVAVGCKGFNGSGNVEKVTCKVWAG